MILILNQCSINKLESTEGQINHVARSLQGLTAWAIGLHSPYEIGRARELGGVSNVNNPAHWIAISDEECNGVGIPLELKINCPIGESGVIGITYLRFNSDTNRIYDTTILLLDSFMNDSSISEAEKQSVYTHEIGHALGLGHYMDLNYNGTPYVAADDETSHVMYWNTNGADHPAVKELAVVSGVYSTDPSTEPVDPGDSWHLYFYSEIASGVYTYSIHDSKPMFTVYPYQLPFPTKSEIKLEKGPKIEGNLTTVIHKMKRGGKCDVEVLDGNFELRHMYKHRH